MKFVCIIALLFCMVLAPVAVVAGGEVLENEVATISLVEIFNEADETENFETEIIHDETSASEAARLFGLIHSHYLMAVEEAYGYLLLHDENEKQDFYSEIAAIREDMAALEAEIAMRGDEYPALVDGFEMASSGLDEFVAAAEQMFASYEETGSPVIDDVKAFEAEVESVYQSITWTWGAYSGRVPPHADGSMRMLYNTLFAAAWESYEYLLKGDANDKEAYLNHVSYFDAKVMEFAEKYPDISYDEVILAKEGLVEIIDALMTSFDEDGAPDMELLISLESVIEDIQDGILDVHGISPIDDGEMAEAVHSSDAAPVDEEAFETA